MKIMKKHTWKLSIYPWREAGLFFKKKTPNGDRGLGDSLEDQWLAVQAKGQWLRSSSPCYAQLCISMTESTPALEGTRSPQSSEHWQTLSWTGRPCFREKGRRAVMDNARYQSRASRGTHAHTHARAHTNTYTHAM